MQGRHDESPTVTIFADHGPLVSEIVEQIQARGAGTHTVSIEVGWVEPVSCAVLVLDSAAGMSAIRALSDLPTVGGRVVAVITDPDHAEARTLCEGCRDRHDLVMMRLGADAPAEQIAEQVAAQLVGGHRG